MSVVDHVAPGHEVYILPPAAADIDLSRHRDLVADLARAHARGAIMCSVCVGVIWLAEAGVIGKRRVTTHWGLEAQMQARYPDIVTDADQILIEYADLTTAGGMMAWVDLCMSLIERFIGRDAMVETSRRFVVDIRRPDQRRYRSFIPDLLHGDPAIRKVQLLIESDFAAQHTLRGLAGVAGMAERSFARRFNSVTGLPPMAYIQAVRMEKAKDMLIHATRPVQQIAFEVGYANHSAFGRRFFEATGLTPSDFRKMMRGQGGA